MVDITQEGAVINSIFAERLSKNKNMLIAVTGATGSGKSLTCVRMAELWYKYHFKNKEFPKENICFSINELMQRLVKGNLKRGDLLILEEAGTSMGSLDFQSKISKSFNYILQTFRSRNIIVLLNLPYFSMLNKTTRMLMHGAFEMLYIDHENKLAIIKPLMLQVNQRTGKTFYKYPRVLVNGSYEAMMNLAYNLPSKELWNAYEEKKKNFVNGLSQEVLDAIEKIRIATEKKLKPDLNLTDYQIAVKKCVDENPNQLNVREIAQKTKIKERTVAATLQSLAMKGYDTREKVLYNRKTLVK